MAAECRGRRALSHTWWPHAAVEAPRRCLQPRLPRAFPGWGGPGGLGGLGGGLVSPRRPRRGLGERRAPLRSVGGSWLRAGVRAGKRGGAQLGCLLVWCLERREHSNCVSWVISLINQVYSADERIMPKRCWELPGEGKRRLSYEQLGEVFVPREERERCPGRHGRLPGAVPGDLRHCCARTGVTAAANTRSHQAAASLHPGFPATPSGCLGEPRVWGDVPCWLP